MPILARGGVCLVCGVSQALFIGITKQRQSKIFLKMSLLFFGLDCLKLKKGRVLRELKTISARPSKAFLRVLSITCFHSLVILYITFGSFQCWEIY